MSCWALLYSDTKTAARWNAWIFFLFFFDKENSPFSTIIHVLSWSLVKFYIQIPHGQITLLNLAL